MIDYFNIKNKLVIDDLKILINSKKYEMIVKSIKYFFNNFFNFSDKKLVLSKIINLSEMDLKTLRKTLSDLKKSDIYDHEANSPYYRVFISIYEKKEAIDFLMRNIKSNDKEFKELSKKLQYKLDPTNRSISIDDIKDTIECLKIFNSLKDLDPAGIINYIKLLSEEQIKTFERE